MLIEHESNVVGSSGLKQTSSFKIASSAHAFRILSSGLYSDKISAVLREIGCNAMDAHIAAGKSDLPFEVHLPSRLTSKFFIRDFGPGMSPDEILALYTTYFSSSKQQSNEFTGAFGLGSKSPFSYTDSFTIVSVNGGKKYTYSAYVDQVGGPSVSLVSEEPAPTDWDSGMMISLPVRQHDVNEFYQKAQHIFSWFRVVPRMVNSQPITPREYAVETPYFACPKDADQHSQPSVVMGNVRYPVPWDECNDDDYAWARSLRPILRMPIGAVDVAASREQLEFTPKTRTAIKNAMNNATAHVGTELAEHTKQFDLTTISGMRIANKWLHERASKWGNSTFKGLLRMGGLDDGRIDQLDGFMGSSPYLRAPDGVECKMWTYHTDGRGRLRMDIRDTTSGLGSSYLPGDLRHNSAVLLVGKTKYLKDRLRHELRTNKFDYLSIIQDVTELQAIEIAKKLYDYPVVKAEDLGLPSDWIPPSQRPKKPRKPAGADAFVKMALIDHATGTLSLDTSYALEDVTEDQKFYVYPTCAWGKYRFFFAKDSWQSEYDGPMRAIARIAQHVPEIPSGIAIVKLGDVKRYHLEDKHGWKFVGELADILMSSDVRNKVNSVKARELGCIYPNGNQCSRYDSPLIFIASHAKVNTRFWQALMTRIPTSHIARDAMIMAAGKYTTTAAKPIPLDAYNNALDVFGNRRHRIESKDQDDPSVTLYPTFKACLDYTFPNKLVSMNPELAADLVARLIEADETHLPSTIDLLAA